MSQQQIGWNTEEKLLHEILKQLEILTKVMGTFVPAVITTTTTTTSHP
jgi:hypothetical protein